MVERFTGRLNVVVKPSEKDIIINAAEALNMTVSDFVRYRLVEHSRNVLLRKDGKLDVDTLIVLDANRTSSMLKK